jgi:hypothetical protein
VGGWPCRDGQQAPYALEAGALRPKTKVESPGARDRGSLSRTPIAFAESANGGPGYFKPWNLPRLIPDNCDSIVSEQNYHKHSLYTLSSTAPDSIMFSFRTASRSVPGFRAFSTARMLQSELAYQVFGPENGQAGRPPILFLHGLFGSKQNNRSISKYV